ncbi:hypothetical protein BH11ARM2_BH11ARM2_01300 [soil metagenome]
MKRRSLLLAALTAALVGCGGGGGGGSTNARQDVEDYLSQLERAYDDGVYSGSSSSYASLISLSYCQNGLDRSAAIDQFRFDTGDATDAGATQAFLSGVSINNARYSDNDNILRADVTYRVIFESNSGREVDRLPLFQDTLILRYEGGRYREYGNGQCTLTKGGAPVPAVHRIGKPKTQ